MIRISDIHKSIDDVDALTRNEFYQTLSFYGIVKIESFTFVPGKYGSSASPPTNESVQVYVVPSNLSDGTVIKTHLWGGGGRTIGGYTYGEFIVKSPGNFVDSNPLHLYPGMELCVQVGDAGGRAAIWRKGTTNFNSYIKELLVAGASGRGGSGNPYGGGSIGGESADTTSTYYEHYSTAYKSYGGTQSAGGAVGGGVSAGPYHYKYSVPGAVGARVWGGTNTSYGSINGGDGYYGGGSGSYAYIIDWDWGVTRTSAASSGGGGAGYFVPGIQNAVITPGNTGLITPPGSNLSVWGMNAGTANNPGRVAFEVSLSA